MKRLSCRLALMLLPALACLLVGCSGKKNGGAGAVNPDDLKMVALALLNHSDAARKGPAKPEDLAPYLENDEKLLGKLRSGDIVVIWNVWVGDLAKKPGGNAGYVVAYEKDAPTKGGYVAMGDVEVKKVTADEFKTLKLAEPKK